MGKSVIHFSVYLDDFVYMESRGKILKYKIISIHIDRHGIVYQVFNEEDEHRITVPEKWIGERVFINEEDVK